MEANDDRCPGCGQPVGCGVAAGKATCWCMELPAGLPMPAASASRCYCAACLKRLSDLVPDVREARE